MAHTGTLNLAFDRGDERETVIKNLDAFAGAIGISKDSVISLGQIHSTRVISVDERSRGRGYILPDDEKCDGYVTNTPGVALGVKTADCVPILMCDSGAGVIGAVHAGWRGTAGKISEECIKELVSLGASCENIHVAIGPAIHSCCYEVGEDFRDSVRQMIGSAVTDKFVTEKDGHLFADIVGMNKFILVSCGIKDNNIDVCKYCTCCHPELFFSHRFSKGIRGTMLSVISM